MMNCNVMGNIADHLAASCSPFQAPYLHEFVGESWRRLSGQRRVDILLLHDWPKGAASPEEAAGKRRSGNGQGPGNETARLLVDLLQPQLTLAGHMHWGHRSHLSERTQFVGLGHVDKGREAFAVFQCDEGGEIVEVDE